MTKKEKIIIDMRKTNPHDLYVLAKLLLDLSAVLSSHGYTISIKKNKQSTPQKPLPAQR